MKLRYTAPKIVVHILSADIPLVTVSKGDEHCGCTCGCASSDINPHCKHTGVGAGCVGCPYCYGGENDTN